MTKVSYWVLLFRVKKTNHTKEISPPFPIPTSQHFKNEQLFSAIFICHKRTYSNFLSTLVVLCFTVVELV